MSAADPALHERREILDGQFGFGRGKQQVARKPGLSLLATCYLLLNSGDGALFCLLASEIGVKICVLLDHVLEGELALGVGADLARREAPSFANVSGHFVD